MSDVLFVISGIAFLAMPIILIILVIKLFRKKPKRKTVIVLIATFIIFVLSGIIGAATACQHEDRDILKEEAPTCTVEGYVSFHCNLCDEDITETIDALGHDLVEVNRVDNSMVKNCSSVMECSICGYQEVILLENVGGDEQGGIESNETDDEKYTGDNREIIEKSAEEHFDDANVSDELRDIFYESFNEYYSASAYIDLIDISAEKSATPHFAISDKAFFVEKEISSYDKHEVSFIVLNTEGKVMTNYNEDWYENDIEKCGDFAFIRVGESKDYDVINEDGVLVNTIGRYPHRIEIGEGYIFLVGDKSTKSVGLLNKNGEFCDIIVPSDLRPSYHTILNENSETVLDDSVEIGKMSEGLFYTLADSTLYLGRTFTKNGVTYTQKYRYTSAYYYNTKGEVVIDLSEPTVNFQITKLSDFQNGQAEIEFWGADGITLYYAIIDKNGNFIDEPKELEF